MKPKRGEKVKTACVRCGKIFSYVFYSRRRNICDSCVATPRQRENVSLKTRRQRLRKEQAARKKKQKGRLSLDEKIREATRLHLSYGKYMVLVKARQH
jgi:hypothetical protein|nr:MAG TPA: Protein of unknown function (DUF2688) [Caudoviricetes sp.]